jgi:capsular exopolysaccharide synthesis family protein
MLNQVAWPTLARAHDPHAPDLQEATIDLIDAFRIVRRRWVLIVGILILAISAGVVYLVVTPTRYTASSLLLFDTRQTPPFQSQSYPNSVADSAYVDSQLEILKSESIARSVIRTQNLLSDPDFASQGSGVLNIVGMAVNSLLGAGTGEASREFDQWRRAIARFQANLTIKRIGSTYIIQVGYQSPDANKAALISNAVTHAYIIGQLGSKLQAARYADAWLQERIGTLKTQAQNAERAVAEYKAKTNVVDPAARPPNEQQLSDLSSERRVALKDLESSAQTYRALYETFLQRVSEVTQQQSFPAAESRVVSEASALLVKRDPKALLVLGAASLLGFVCGIGAAFAREHLKTGFRTSGDVEKQVGVDCLGILPAVKPAHAPAAVLPNDHRARSSSGDLLVPPVAGRYRFVVGEPFSHFAETIRSLKVAADLADSRRPNKIVGVTSARPREGKSVVAANLAEMIALSGCRVLLIDCNLRNTELTRQFAPEANAGLMDVLSGHAAVKDIKWVDPISNLDFLPAPPAVKNLTSHNPNMNEDLQPATLCRRSQLTPTELQKLLQSVEDRYDYVILDLPRLTVTDVKATAHLINFFILVIEWGCTSRQAVIDALKTSRFVSTKLLGAVLNKANPREFKKLES